MGEKKALIQKTIRQVKARVLRNRRSRKELSIEAINEEETVWEPEDVSANVVGEVLLKEKIALLAQDDPRKKRYWQFGTEDAQTIRKFHRFWRSDLEEIPSLTVSSSNGSGHTANPN
ncbi:hypothetical protein QKW52_15230 [Bacillus sonorensis]|nr:hypothetical protein [Bacillus sonorensis]